MPGNQYSWTPAGSSTGDTPPVIDTGKTPAVYTVETAKKVDALVSGAGVSLSAYSAVTFPGATPIATDSGLAGNLTGTYYYTCFYYTATGKTDITTAVPTPVTVSGKKVNLTGIPVSTDPTVIGRGICRNLAADGNANSFPRQWIVALIPDNTTTTYVDNIADGSLTQAAPRISTLSGFLTSGGSRVGNFFGISQGIGQNALPGGTGYANVMIGTNAGQSVVNGIRNTGIGTLAMSALTNGDQNTGIGTHALGNITGSSSCTAIGYAALESLATTEAFPSTAVGAFALQAANGATGGNVALGYQAGQNASSANQTVLIGLNTGRANTASTANVLVGASVAGAATSGNFNTAIGHSALGSLTTAGSIVALGAYAGNYATGTSSEFFLNNQDRTNYAGDQTLSLMYGSFAATADAQRLFINALTAPARIPTASRPAWSAALKGCIYFDTTTNKLVVAGASAWETVTSV